MRVYVEAFPGGFNIYWPDHVTVKYDNDPVFYRYEKVTKT